MSRLRSSARRLRPESSKSTSFKKGSMISSNRCCKRGWHRTTGGSEGPGAPMANERAAHPRNGQGPEGRRRRTRRASRNRVQLCLQLVKKWIQVHRNLIHWASPNCRRSTPPAAAAPPAGPGKPYAHESRQLAVRRRSQVRQGMRSIANNGGPALLHLHRI